ncbi:MAG: class I SAM-dependent methyltransferase [Flavobacteriales bacterium]|nr:class I SAM-dependent methyltransferase [Flavobacteriales bacterium]
MKINSQVIILRLIKYFLRSLLLRGPFQSVKLLLEESKNEKIYGIETREIVVHSSNSQFPYQACSYYVLKKILHELTPNTNFHFIDIGCGLGRVLMVAKHFGFRKLTGIELSSDLINKARQETNKHKSPDSELKLYCEDATLFNYPNENSVVFLFNPFDASTLKKFLTRLLEKNQHEIVLVYANPVFDSTIDNFPFQKVKTIKTNFYTEAIIYRKTTWVQK